MKSSEFMKDLEYIVENLSNKNEYSKVISTVKDIKLKYNYEVFIFSLLEESNSDKFSVESTYSGIIPLRVFNLFDVILELKRTILKDKLTDTSKKIYLILNKLPAIKYTYNVPIDVPYQIS